MVVLTFAGSNQHSFRHTTILEGSANLCRLQPTQPDTLVSPEDRGSRRGVYGESVGPAHSLHGGPPQSGAAVEPPEQLSVYRTPWAPPKGQSRNSWGEDGARRKDGEKQNRKRGIIGQHTKLRCFNKSCSNFLKHWYDGLSGNRHATYFWQLVAWANHFRSCCKSFLMLALRGMCQY